MEVKNDRIKNKGVCSGSRMRSNSKLGIRVLTILVYCEQIHIIFIILKSCIDNFYSSVSHLIYYLCI